MTSSEGLHLACFDPLVIRCNYKAFCEYNRLRAMCNQSLPILENENVLPLKWEKMRQERRAARIMEAKLNIKVVAEDRNFVFHWNFTLIKDDVAQVA